MEIDVRLSEKAKLYLEYRTRGGLSYIKYSSMEKLAEVSGIIFDCDGVLIDEKTSYDKVIKEVTSSLVEILTGFKFDQEWIPVETIYRIRDVGSFNNDANTIRLLVDWVVSKIASEVGEEIGDRLEKLSEKSLKELLAYSAVSKPLSEKKIKDWMTELGQKLSGFEGSAASLDALEEKLSLDFRLIESVKNAVKPGLAYGVSLLTTAFEDSFYGAHEVVHRRKDGPFFGFEGRLKDEKVIVTSDTLEILVGRGLRLGMCTGRGSWETWKTLGDLEKFFDKQSCVFISDYIEADPENAGSYEKPNPWSLIQAAKSMETSGMKLYVGNSTEDFLMYLKAVEQVDGLLFAGVTDSDYRRLDYMLENEVDLVIPSVNVLPKIFQLIEEI
ncbi:MAG: hypothetical protein RMI43_04675 [Candidatus Caldarchaeum sp.]|nr:HAD family hydrolase [Candidatus Caldarchaeum sp.]MDW8063446.1 hypothetical protein [Candidatus Caldarchaeum sp.]